MARDSLPPGFRFHPTDVELVMYYLKKKVMGKLGFEGISEIELYKFSPWDLPEKSCLKSRDLEWYFFCPRDRKYSNGPRANRATDIGYWKTTGKDRSVCHNSKTVGMKKTLIFHLGRAPRGDRTNWVMHEYRLEDQALVDRGISQDAYVLCKIFEKSGPGPKNGEQHGAPFREEEWDDDDNVESITFYNPSFPPRPVDCQNLAVVESAVDINSESDAHGGSSPECSEALMVNDGQPELINIDEFLAELEVGASVSDGNAVEKPDQIIPRTCDNVQNASLPNGGDENNLAYDLDRMISDLINGNIILENDLPPPPVHAGPIQKAEEMGHEYVQQSSSGGEQHTVHSTLEHLSSGDGSYSKFQYLLDSYPAPPASAAEYSPLKGEDPKCNLVSYSSPIHVKAEVTLKCMCTGSLLSDRLGPHPCICCCGGKPSKKLGREPSSHGGGFMLVFLLGMFSALMWVFLFAMGAKFGRYAWKNFIQPS
ncbi:NAC domain-containing protein 37-like protein isoform X2 [Cinnamomum micranthum f. kanehirae]|uniref:NAC domain-containing protein 37-like protein isoform X2 n=1 Tax=Cinnamomum micranthum f. kanehirae TaxID=337451 RepID=A0A443PPV6_9MAGN|nr:NAC domain-containing protein 37-like protein isoform X2 [Cinnamomum micranthum f. kanehirae]